MNDDSVLPKHMFITLLFFISLNSHFESLGSQPSRPSHPTSSGSGEDGSYKPTGDGQYIHMTGPEGAGPDPYNHVTGPQGNSVITQHYHQTFSALYSAV